MKRFLCLALALVMLLSLCACADSSSTKKEGKDTEEEDNGKVTLYLRTETKVDGIILDTYEYDNKGNVTRSVSYRSNGDLISEFLKIKGVNRVSIY